MIILFSLVRMVQSTCTDDLLFFSRGFTLLARMRQQGHIRL